MTSRQKVDNVILDLTDHYAHALAAVVDAQSHAHDRARPAEPVDLMDDISPGSPPARRAERCCDPWKRL